MGINWEQGWVLTTVGTGVGINLEQGWASQCHKLVTFYCKLTPYCRITAKIRHKAVGDIKPNDINTNAAESAEIRGYVAQHNVAFGIISHSGLCRSGLCRSA